MFTSHDPEDQFASPYAYGPGDPLNGTDPTGRDFGIGALLLTIAIVSAVAKASYAGIKTGDVELALQSLTIDLSLIFLTNVAAAPITEGLNAIGGARLVASYRIAQVGYSTYGIAQSARNGDTIGAVSGGLSLLVTAYGIATSESGRSALEIVSGRSGNPEVGAMGLP